MKRIILLFAAAACAALSASKANAQIAARLELGMTEYKTTCFSPLQINSVYGSTVQLGADYDIHVKGKFYITPGLYWSYRTALENSGITEVAGSETLQEHFLNVPVHAKWKFNIKPGKFGMYIYVGPTFSAGLSSRSTFDMRVSGYSVEGTYNYFNGEADFRIPSLPGASGEFNDEMQKQFDALGLRYSRIDARLDWGVGFVLRERHELVLGADFAVNNKITGSLAKDYSINNSTLYIGYRYRFGKM